MTEGTRGRAPVSDVFSPFPGRRSPVGLLAVTLFGFLAAATACGGSGSSGAGWVEDFQLPPELRGRWVTDAPRYRDRMLELRREVVVFHTGDLFGVFAHRIREGRTREGSRPGTLYELRYRAESAEELYTLSFYYRPEDEGRIRLANQPEILWVPRDGPSNEGT